MVIQQQLRESSSQPEAKPKLVVVDAGEHWTQRLYSELASTHDVLLVKLPTPRALIKGKGVFFSKTTRLENGVQVLSVQMPPWYLTTMWPLARRLITIAVRAAGFGEPDVLVLSYPYYTELIEQLGAKKSLYYIYDEYSKYWPRHAESVLAKEAALIAKADVVITVSKYNADRLKAMHPARADAIHHVPNGLNPKYMADQLEPAPLPPALAEIPAPRAGYIGSLNFRFDYALLAEVASQRPDVSFVLGGWYPNPVPDTADWKAAFARAKSMPNVHFIGEVPFEELGHYWMGFDVFLIPYAKCLFNDVACPIKLWDYLGIGGPIVANDSNPETLLWADYVRICATPEAFAQGIDEALAEGRSRAPELMAVAREHTWDKIARRVEAIIEGLPAGG